RNRSGGLFRPRHRTRKNPPLPGAVPGGTRRDARSSRARPHVGDDGQVIGTGAGASVDVALDERRTGPAVYPVEAQERPPRRKGTVTRIAGKLARQRGAHRPGPEPIVEVADHHGGDGAYPGNVEERAGLIAPLANAQAEMRRDDAQRPE